jgi:hypothetical protein
MTNKEIGNKALGKAIEYFTSNNYIVSLPLNDTQDYDLIVDNGTLLKIQVKGTTQLSQYNIPIVSVRSCGGTKGTQYKTVKDTKIDFMFVYHLISKQKWLIPIVNITASSTMSLGDKYKQFEI